MAPPLPRSFALALSLALATAAAAADDDPSARAFGATFSGSYEGYVHPPIADMTLTVLNATTFLTAGMACGGVQWSCNETYALLPNNSIALPNWAAADDCLGAPFRGTCDLPQIALSFQPGANTVIMTAQGKSWNFKMVMAHQAAGTL
jgi:hypothetical protein